MFRAFLGSLLVVFALALAGAAQPAAASSPILIQPNQPVQVGPWRALVPLAYVSRESGTPVLAVRVQLTNTSATSQPILGAGLFTCYRADVWQGVTSLNSVAALPAVVTPGQTASGTLRYALSPEVESFGLVFFWQGPGGSATGTWLLQLRAPGAPHLEMA